MKVENLRFGFATNSSSSHSIILDPMNKTNNDDYHEGEFGWDFFTLASKEAKEEYLSVMLRENFRRSKMPTLLQKVILNGLDLPFLEEFTYVDHQSSYCFPVAYGTDFVCMHFISDFREYLIRDDVCVKGGNDNEDAYGDYGSERLDTGNYYPDMLGWVCRKDGDWWVLYNNQTGIRTTFSFEDDPEPFVPNSPMLVDMKITNFCKKNCSFCYMGSSVEGNHMSKDNVYSLVANLHRERVFEVAIGGGEPTQCPVFEDILQCLNSFKIVANFSTASLDWLKDGVRTERILSKVGAFAYSVQTKEDLKEFLDLVSDLSMSKVTVQVIPDTLTEDSLKEMLTMCYESHVRVTLLGFKEVERGSSYIRTGTEKKWLSIIKELYAEKVYVGICIDTVLAQRSEDMIKEEQIPSYLFHTTDGEFSVFIDAVELQCSPSSYEPDKLQD